MTVIIFQLLHMSCFEQSCQIVANMFGVFIQPMIVNPFAHVVPPIV